MKKFLLLTTSYSSDHFEYFIESVNRPSDEEIYAFLAIHGNDKDDEEIYESIDKLIEITPTSFIKLNEISREQAFKEDLAALMLKHDSEISLELVNRKPYSDSLYVMHTYLNSLYDSEGNCVKECLEFDLGDFISKDL